MAHIQMSENNYRSWFLPSILWTPGTDFPLSGWTMIIFSCQVISPFPFPFLSFLFLKIFFNCMHLSVLLEYINMHCICFWFPWRWEEGIGTPGTLVTDGCELPFRCWELNPGPWWEHQVPLTSEPSLQPLFHFASVVTSSKNYIMHRIHGLYEDVW